MKNRLWLFIPIGILFTFQASSLLFHLYTQLHGWDGHWTLEMKEVKSISLILSIIISVSFIRLNLFVIRGFAIFYIGLTLWVIFSSLIRIIYSPDAFSKSYLFVILALVYSGIVFFLFNKKTWNLIFAKRAERDHINQDKFKAKDLKNISN